MAASIRRETDAALINLISNSGGVREHVCYKNEPMDWETAFPANKTGVVVLSNGTDACAVFAETGPRRWQSHTMFASTCRGRMAIDTALAMIDRLRPLADVIWGATPVRNCAARWFNRQIGAVAVRRDTFDAEGEVEIFEIRVDS